MFLIGEYKWTTEIDFVQDVLKFKLDSLSFRDVKDSVTVSELDQTFVVLGRTLVSASMMAAFEKHPNRVRRKFKVPDDEDIRDFCTRTILNLTEPASDEITFSGQIISM